MREKKKQQQSGTAAEPQQRRQLDHCSSGQKKTSNVERGLLQMQHLLVCLQGTVGDHTGGINKDCKQFKRELFLLPLSLPVHYRFEIFFFFFAANKKCSFQT